MDDTIADGPIGYTHHHGPAVSVDPKFTGMDPGDVQVTNFDNDFSVRQAAIQPLGSLIYDAALDGIISSSGRTESYLVFRPPPGPDAYRTGRARRQLAGNDQVTWPGGTTTTTAPAAGADALVQTVRIPWEPAGNGAP